MQIGIRLHDTKKGTLEERVAIAEEQGFSCAHLALKKVISEYFVADSALTPGFSCYLKKLFAAHHLDIAVLGCYLNLASICFPMGRYVTYPIGRGIFIFFICFVIHI